MRRAATSSDEPSSGRRAVSFSLRRNKMKYTGMRMFMDKLKHLIYCNHNPLINNPLVLSQRPQFPTLHTLLSCLFISRWIDKSTGRNKMKYTGMRMLMDNLKQLIYCNHNPLINNPLILSQRPQFLLLYQELGSMIQSLFNIQEDHHLHELEKFQNLMTRFKDTVEEAQDMIDLFLSAVHVRSSGLFTRSDVFMDHIKDVITGSDVLKTSLDLEDVMRSIESIKVEFLTMINTNNMKISKIDSLKTQSAAAAGGTRNPKKPLEEVVVGLDRDAELIRDKLVEDTKQLDVVSIVGMGGLGKTTLATKLFNDRFIVYHFHVRAWATVSQTYVKRDFLIQILTSSGVGVQQDLEEADVSKLREKLHKHLMGRRYLIVIDDIWSTEAWDDLKLFFPRENTGSRILLTTRLNEVALHAKPHGFVHSLAYLTEEQSWELLRKRVFHGDECPDSLIKPGIQIARKCQGLPLSVVVMAGVLAKETMKKDLWENIACSVGSYILNDQKLGCFETLALSYHHLPHHLRECFLYLGGFPEDFRIHAKRLIWLWGAEGFIENVGNQSLEETAKSYLMDLIDINLVIVVERKFNSEIKACKLHDLVRELCQQKAKEERFFIKIDSPYEVITPYKQRFVFTNQYINIVNTALPPIPSVRSLFGFHMDSSLLIYDIAEYFHSFALLRVLVLIKCRRLHSFPQEMTLLVHLRYLAISYSCFPSSICNLWSLQTLILETHPYDQFGMNLPHNISDLVNLRHLWSNRVLILPTIEKPMNLQSISKVRFRDGVDNFVKCFPSVKKLEYTLISGEESHFELLPYLENLKLSSSKAYVPRCLPNHIWFPATLKKLTIVKCGLPWSDMSIIQSLPNLEVLKLKHLAFQGRRWNASEQAFRQLKFLSLEGLQIEQWEAYSTSFPCLKRLALRSCLYLKEIPLEIGEIATLELIEIYDRSKSTERFWESYTELNSAVVKSAKRILREQHDQGNTELKITYDGKELSVYLCEDEDSGWE